LFFNASYAVSASATSPSNPPIVDLFLLIYVVNLAISLSQFLIIPFNLVNSYPKALYSAVDLPPFWPSRTFICDKTSFDSASAFCFFVLSVPLAAPKVEFSLAIASRLAFKLSKAFF
jgi:hypothetical protein